VVKTADDREWCRVFIDHYCIYRSPPGEHLLPSKAGCNAWQFYLPIALLNTEFAFKIGDLFWDKFYKGYLTSPFQICGCESGGSLLASVLQAAGKRHLLNVGAFMIKKAAKTYGLRNWIEGVALPEVPVLLVDDVVGSGKTIKTQWKRLTDFGFKICGFWAVAGVKNAVADVEPLFNSSEFERFLLPYRAKYGIDPEFRGTIV